MSEVPKYPIHNDSSAFPPRNWEHVKDKIDKASATSSNHELWAEMSERHDKQQATCREISEASRLSNTAAPNQRSLITQEMKDKEWQHHDPKSGSSRLWKTETGVVRCTMADFKEDITDCYKNKMHTVTEDAELYTPKKLLTVSEKNERNFAYGKLAEYKRLLDSPAMTSRLEPSIIGKMIAGYTLFIHHLIGLDPPSSFHPDQKIPSLDSLRKLDQSIAAFIRRS